MSNTNIHLLPLPPSQGREWISPRRQSDYQIWKPPPGILRFDANRKGRLWVLVVGLASVAATGGLALAGLEFWKTYWMLGFIPFAVALHYSSPQSLLQAGDHWIEFDVSGIRYNDYAVSWADVREALVEKTYFNADGRGEPELNNLYLHQKNQRSDIRHQRSGFTEQRTARPLWKLRHQTSPDHALPSSAAPAFILLPRAGRAEAPCRKGY